MVRPGEDLALYRAEMAEWPGPGEVPDWRAYRDDWVRANDACRRDILSRLALGGAAAVARPSGTCAVPWKSSGWTNNRNVTSCSSSWCSAARSRSPDAGAASGCGTWRRGSTPTNRRSRGRGAADPQRAAAARAGHRPGPRTGVPGRAVDVGDAGEPAIVEGVKGTWRVDPSLLGQPFSGRAALLSPFDRLIHDRKRTAELFEFDYQLEMYKPAAKRRWGYFALPILYGDRLVGKLDATADRKTGALRVTPSTRTCRSPSR